MKPTTKRSRRLLAFMPALVAICATAYAASGVSVVGTATGASSGTVDVVGTVGSSISFNLTNCADEDLGGSFATAAAVTNGCTVDFESNNGGGSEVVFENNQASAAAFFCADPDRDDSVPVNGPLLRDCTVGDYTVSDLPAGVPVALSTDTFGIGLVSVSGEAGSAKGTPMAAPTAAVATDPMWVGIPSNDGNNLNGQGLTLCELDNAAHTSPTVCEFAFGARGKGGTQVAGHYTGTLKLTVQLK